MALDPAEEIKKEGKNTIRPACAVLHPCKLHIDSGGMKACLRSPTMFTEIESSLANIASTDIKAVLVRSSQGVSHFVTSFQGTVNVVLPVLVVI